MAIEVGHQPAVGETHTHTRKQINTQLRNETLHTSAHIRRRNQHLLDFLQVVVLQLVGARHVLLGPLQMLVGVPAPDHHDVLPLLLVLVGDALSYMWVEAAPRTMVPFQTLKGRRHTPLVV